MASVTNTSSNSANNLYSATDSSKTASSQNSASTSLGGSSALANQSTFLTLLVAQLKNQDPTQPADGMQFVTQLAQFSSLEQNLAMRSDLDTIKGHVSTLASSIPGTQVSSQSNGNPTAAS